MTDNNRINMKCLVQICFLFLTLLNNPIFSEAKYDVLKNGASQARESLAKQYKNGNKQQILAKSRKELHKIITEQLILPWYGTKWAFSGTTSVPNEGTIACGYLVTTLLRDAGVKLERVRLAQQASENIIKSLVTATSIKRFSNVGIEKFINSVKKSGEGLYIVGLDYHVGFLSVTKEGVYFIHSSYIEPKQVVKELALDSAILKVSKYRVTGSLNDESFIRKWLGSENFKTIK